jgi:hypothetical protein
MESWRDGRDGRLGSARIRKLVRWRVGQWRGLESGEGWKVRKWRVLERWRVEKSERSRVGE